MRLRTAFWTIVISVAFAGVGAVAAPTRCLHGLVPALVAGGFSGSTDCKRDELSLRFVGEVRSFGRTFRIYENRYRLKPACPECTIRGGQRIIFMERGRYVGQYKPDLANIIVRQERLFLGRTDLPDAKLISVRFTPKGPTERHWDGREVLDLFR